jgi:hypothetical protein
LIGWACVLGGVTIACACNVPVFRFALERWRADSYQAVLFHRGPLDDATREQIAPLMDLQDQGLANLAIRTVDVSQLNESSDGGADEIIAADAALFRHLGSPESPTLVVQYPPHLNISKPVWSGTPSREAIAMLGDSPVRQDLVRRLAAGQTAVWLLLECGDVERDSAAATLLEAKLKELQQELKLPELTTSPDDVILADAPLKVEFSMIRVPRDSAAEEALVAMLIGCESDLAERADPMIFPVFGRGRALLPLIGAGITAQNIHDSAAFLVGPCSCEVKEQNPGFDLLLRTDWDELLTHGGQPIPPAPALSSAEPKEAELVPIPAGAPPAVPVRPTSAEVFQSSHSVTILRPGLWLIGGGILVGLIAIALIAVVVSLSASRTRDSAS